ncbi:ankyrin repeat-containing domain, PGG domain protein, partial [Tanacetum coccineum]
METEMGQEASVPLSTIIEQSPQNHAIQIHPLARSGRRGKRDNHSWIDLYKACITYNCKVAEEIFEKEPSLKGYEMGQEASVPLSTIIEQSPQNHAIQIHPLARSGRRALLVAASARRTPRGAQFVKKLVVEMEEAQLELKDNSGNTALCLAAINGNLEVVEIMVAKHKALLSMPDWEGMMPLCKAALFGRYDVVKYLFDKSDGLRGDSWDARNRAWLLQKCVEGDMFDIALQILTEHIELANDEELLRILARKPDAFVKKSSNFLTKTVIWVFAFVCPKEGHPKKDTEALQLLKMIIKDMINRDD